jgi:hypothetical protein
MEYVPGEALKNTIRRIGPLFDNLRGEPGFQAIFEKEKGLYEERLRKFGGL